ncbi:GTPase IMAP family member 9-like [Phycodurus eques]|uniref:GTPase IMAP family member 9-like n=1 Tax=Phycodurus eques TaxID=693459 RepID=UPI002ACE2117|nr:GTPase IMAP family member 9-like [Phycodurus eques]
MTGTDYFTTTATPQQWRNASKVLLERARNGMASSSKPPSPKSGTGRSSSSSLAEIRLVLLGKTGSGKSSTANSILGRKLFDAKVGSSSGTRRSRRACGEIRGRHLVLLDTPGILDPTQTPQDVQKALRKTVSLLSPGPHVFLLIIQISGFAREDKEVVRHFKQALGFHALRLSIVVFTHGDCLEEGVSVKQRMLDMSPDLRELVTQCGGRYCVFDNQSSGSKEQTSELLAIVDRMMRPDHGGTRYAGETLQRAGEEPDRRRPPNYEDNERKKKREAEMKARYERELVQKRERETEELKKQHETEEEKLADLEGEAFREMAREMPVHTEEEAGEALRHKLEHINKILEEAAATEKILRQVMEEIVKVHTAENERKEKDIRQREEMQRELAKLSQSSEEQKKQTQDLLKKIRKEREESPRSAAKHLSGFVQEMALMGLNASLQHAGTKCSVQ